VANLVLMQLFENERALVLADDVVFELEKFMSGNEHF
jgi:hypothetical protein